MSQIDFDLHGFVGVRLLDATIAEADAVRRQLGPIERPLTRPPDLTIRFADGVEEGVPTRIIGTDDVGFTRDTFLVLRGRMNAPVRVALPLDRIGREPSEIVCRHGTLGVPLLIALVNLCALGNGVLPLHASAFVHHGTGVLVTGWAKGGKTEALLAFMSRGAQYVGDEWIYIDGERRMHGIPEPMRLWDWHLRSVPEYARRVGTGARMRLATLRAGTSVLAALAAAPLVPGAPRRLARRALPVARRQLSVQVPPAQLFRGSGSLPSATMERLVLLGNHDAGDVIAEPADAAEIAARMVFSLEYERLELTSYYQRFRFAFPGRSNPLIDGVEARCRELLARAVDGVPAFTLLHPYPVHIPALFDALDPVLGC